MPTGAADFIEVTGLAGAICALYGCWLYMIKRSWKWSLKPFLVVHLGGFLIGLLVCSLVFLLDNHPPRVFAWRAIAGGIAWSVLTGFCLLGYAISGRGSSWPEFLRRRIGLKRTGA